MKGKTIPISNYLYDDYCILYINVSRLVNLSLNLSQTFILHFLGDLVKCHIPQL